MFDFVRLVVVAMMLTAVVVAPLAAQEITVTYPVTIGEPLCMTYDCPPGTPAPCVCAYLVTPEPPAARYRLFLPLIWK